MQFQTMSGVAPFGCSYNMPRPSLRQELLDQVTQARQSVQQLWFQLMLTDLVDDPNLLSDPYSALENLCDSPSPTSSCSSASSASSTSSLSDASSSESISS